MFHFMVYVFFGKICRNRTYFHWGWLCRPLPCNGYCSSFLKFYWQCYYVFILVMNIFGAPTKIGKREEETRKQEREDDGGGRKRRWQ